MLEWTKLFSWKKVGFVVSWIGCLIRWIRYLSIVVVYCQKCGEQVNNSSEKIVKKWEVPDINKNNLEIVYKIPIWSDFNLRFHYFGFETIIFVMNIIESFFKRILSKKINLGDHFLVKTFFSRPNFWTTLLSKVAPNFWRTDIPHRI